MRIALLIPTLNAGGAEKVITNMANYWSIAGNEVFLITFDSLENDDFFALNPNVKRIKIKSKYILKNSFGTIIFWVLTAYSISKILKKHEIKKMISFLVPANFINIFSNFFYKHKVIIAERNNPEIYKLTKIGEKIRHFIYKYSDYLVVQTKNVKNWAVKFLKKEKVVIIANPVNIKDKNIGDNKLIEYDDYILSIGRLDYNKGMDVLIKAFAKVNLNFPDLKLVIVGEGKLKNDLIKLSKDSGVESNVVFHGYSKSPFRLIQKAKFFVLPSRTEGFPNVLLEAMALGKAVISTNCPSGPSEIIQNGVNGILIPVDDVKQLTKAMLTLINNKKLVTKFANNAKAVNEKYGIKKIMKKWEYLIL